MTELVGYVTSEGGPILVGEVDVIRSWRGVDSNDYDRACERFDQDEAAEAIFLEVVGRPALLWEIGGAGAAYVFRRGNDTLVLVRPWLEDPDDEGMVKVLADRPWREGQETGELTVRENALIVLWAAENGDCVEPEDTEADGRPSGEMSVDSAGLIVRVTPGRYGCRTDSVSVDGNSCRRLEFRRL